MFSGGVERDQWYEMGLFPKHVSPPRKLTTFQAFPVLLKCVKKLSTFQQRKSMGWERNYIHSLKHHRLKYIKNYFAWINIQNNANSSNKKAALAITHNSQAVIASVKSGCSG